MATDVIMPQMGESIAEGTIVKWLKKIGDEVKRDEPLFEISTDKVDAEIPSPVAGVLSEIIVPEGQTVPINTVVARIAAPGTRPAAAAAQEKPADGHRPAAPQLTTEQVQQQRITQQQETAAVTTEESQRQRSSPLVRKIARENNIDIGGLKGTGMGGRVTKNDILSYLENKPATRPVAPVQTAPAPVAPTPTTPTTAPSTVPSVPSTPTYQPGERVEIVPMTPMRRKIAEHMVVSRRTSAHVTSVFEIDMTRVAKLREAHKDRFQERHGVKLTFMPFIIKATVEALQAWPVMNASIDGDNIVYKKDINIGMAVALDWGLIVPVIKNADEKNILGLSRAVNDLANRARNKQLKPDEVQGGTFTI
ncbi:MAG: dihydrolipoamide acetyltransferase family protein, partial [Acidobacteriota bacterium]